MTKNHPYETVGDVRQEVNEAVESRGLRTAGGVFYPYTQALIFGLVNRYDDRVGDAYCPLPNGGWVSETYWPARPQVGDGLRFKVIKGTGRLILPTEAAHSIGSHNPGIKADLMPNRYRSFQLINTSDELLV